MNKLMIFLSVLAIFLGLSACQPKEVKEVDLLFETVERRDASGTGQVYQDRQPSLMVITTPEEAASLGALVTPKAQAQLQNLNYSTYFAIAIFQGRKSTTGYGVEIERITRLESKVTIYARFLEPKPNAERAPEETSPYHLVQVQKTGMWGQSITFDLVEGDTVVTSLSYYVP